MSSPSASCLLLECRAVPGQLLLTSSQRAPAQGAALFLRPPHSCHCRRKCRRGREASWLPRDRTRPGLRVLEALRLLGSWQRTALSPAKALGIEYNRRPQQWCLCRGSSTVGGICASLPGALAPCCHCAGTGPAHIQALGCQGLCSHPLSPPAAGERLAQHTALARHAARGEWCSPAAPTCLRAASQARKSQRFLRPPGPGAFSSSTAGRSPTGGTSPASPFQGIHEATGCGHRILSPVLRYPAARQPPNTVEGKNPAGRAQARGVSGSRWHVAGSASLPVPEDELMEASWAQPRFPQAPACSPAAADFPLLCGPVNPLPPSAAALCCLWDPHHRAPLALPGQPSTSPAGDGGLRGPALRCPIVLCCLGGSWGGPVPSHSSAPIRA